MKICVQLSAKSFPVVRRSLRQKTTPKTSFHVFYSPLLVIQETCQHAFCLQPISLVPCTVPWVTALPNILRANTSPLLSSVLMNAWERLPWSTLPEVTISMLIYSSHFLHNNPPLIWHACQDSHLFFSQLISEREGERGSCWKSHCHPSHWFRTSLSVLPDHSIRLLIISLCTALRDTAESRIGEVCQSASVWWVPLRSRGRSASSKSGKVFKF